ncbi:MAG: glycosyltransferase family 39 protein [Armatimonadota bacterium]
MQQLHRYAPTAVLGVYAALAVAWSLVIPLGGGIDEPRHLRYLQILVEEGRLPTPAEKAEAISHHPPLHYLIAAPVYLVTRGLGRETGWQVLRLMQVLLGGATVLVVLATLRRAFPEREWLPFAGAAAVALLPHFLLICAVFSNDVSAALCGALVLYLTVRPICEPHRATLFAALAGLAAGAGVLTRMNALVVVPPAGLALALAPLLRMRRDAGARTEGAGAPGSLALRNAVAFAAAFAATGGAWVVHYVGVWGRLEADPPWPEATWPVHGLGAKLVRAVDGLYRATWAQVGWLPGPHSPAPLGPSGLWPRPDLETPILAIMLPITALGIAGSIVLAIRWLRSGRECPQGMTAALLLGTAALAYGVVAHSAVYTNPGRFEGARYAMPAVAASIPLLAIGPLILPPRWTRAMWAVTLAMLAIMNIVSFWEMHVYLIPTFAR